MNKTQSKNTSFDLKIYISLVPYIFLCSLTLYSYICLRKFVLLPPLFYTSLLRTQNVIYTSINGGCCSSSFSATIYVRTACCTRHIIMTSIYQPRNVHSPANNWNLEFFYHFGCSFRQTWVSWLQKSKKSLEE